MTAYQLLPAGVRNLDTGVDITPQDTSMWKQYLRDLKAGCEVVAMAPDIVPIGARQIMAWRRISAKREAVKHGGVLVTGKWFHTDEQSRTQQLGLMLMGSSVPAVPWKTMDGTYITLTEVIVKGIFDAVVALDLAAFSIAEDHRQAMLAAPDPDAYNFSAGWPAIYYG